MNTERIWVRLERPLTGSYLEAHVLLPYTPRDRLFARLESHIEVAFPGWEVVTYCVPEHQKSDGQPIDGEDD